MARRSLTLVDTSVAVALVVADHVAHEPTWESLADRHLGLAGHAWFETFSVLTRLPGPSRRPPNAVAELLAANFPESRFLDEAATEALAGTLAGAGISGGAVYDALVAAAAASHGLPLVSRDQRALDTYRAFAVDVQLLD